MACVYWLYALLGWGYSGMVSGMTVSLSRTKAKKADNRANEDSRAQKAKERVTFIDLFAGAGGASEGFLQAELDDSIYEFLLASDINENAELTHKARYNRQLGLQTKFLRMDIKLPKFIPTLQQMLDGQTVDVVFGGPPCQSFSLAGRRREHDVKDDLFASYLEVIRVLRPKYFVMENVKGILTKDEGRIKSRILHGIRSIIDDQKLPKVLAFIEELATRDSRNLGCRDELEMIRWKVAHAAGPSSQAHGYLTRLVERIASIFRDSTRARLDYKTSKTDLQINTVRHGLRLLRRQPDLLKLRRMILEEKTKADVDNDLLVEDFDRFLNTIDPSQLIQSVLDAYDAVSAKHQLHKENTGAGGVDLVRLGLEILKEPVAETLERVSRLLVTPDLLHRWKKTLEHLHLYHIKDPLILNAAHYGVPQERERVFFIGCRSDQLPIEAVPKTTESLKDKVTAAEAIADLDFLKPNEVGRSYKLRPAPKATRRDKRGTPIADGKTYAQWCREGRLRSEFSTASPRYFANDLAFEQDRATEAELLNHETSAHNPTVVSRLEMIRKQGEYDQSKLRDTKFATGKRDYNVLRKDFPSSTIVTMPDDFIHYAVARSLTVREMARLQSFDDSFVFQGKRTTGGNRRKEELPQYTLVGNAVPPLLARAVADVILKSIRVSKRSREPRGHTLRRY